jgi:hypothetical protein
MNGLGVVAVLAAMGIAGCQEAPAIAAPEPSPAAPTGVQTSAAFGVAFDHAAGLQTRPCDEAMPRCIVLFDPAAEEFMRDLVTVQVFAGPLEAVAAAEGGFERNAEGRLMTTYGRFEPVAVEAFEVNGRSGLRATITCGISDPETGFHAAGGECLWAVVSDGAQSVVISSSGFGNGLEAAGPVVRSIRFTTD